jgi:hypothetical protein
MEVINSIVSYSQEHIGMLLLPFIIAVVAYVVVRALED